MNPADEPWEIAGDLTRKQYLTLAAVRNAGGEARTADVTSSRDELYNELVNAHFRKMLDAGLLESPDRDGPDNDPTPRKKGYTYRITDKGREVLSSAQEDYGLDPLEEGAVRRRFDRLEDRVGGIEDSLQARSESGDHDGDRIDDLEERLTSLEDDFDALVDDTRKVANRLEELREKQE